MVYFAIWTVFAVISYYIALCAKKDLPWLCVNEWICAAVGFFFGWIGLVCILLYLFYEICKNHKYNE